MKKLFLVLLLSLAAAFSYCQTNATFQTIDVRNRETFRGPMYVYDSTFFKPNATNIPLWNPGDTLGYVLSISNGSEAQLVKVTMQTLADSLTVLIAPALWHLSGDTVVNDNNYKVKITDSLYLDLLAVPLIQPGEPISDQVLVLRKLPGSERQLARVSIESIIDTGAAFIPQYWTLYEGEPRDTLKNNVSNTDGIIFLDSASLELPPTTATVGQIKQSGTPLLHTYHEKGNNNLFLGGAGSFTLDSSFNIGIGGSALDALTTGYQNIAIGYNALTTGTTSYQNVAIGYEALKDNISVGNVAIGHKAGTKLTTGGTDNVYIGDIAGSQATGTYGSIGIGREALYGSGTVNGDYNVGIGYQAGKEISTGTNNVFIGRDAGKVNSVGSNNTIIGGSAGQNTTSGSSNIYIGSGAGSLSEMATLSYKLIIEPSSADSTAALIFGNFATNKVTINGDIVYGDTFWDDLSTPATQARIGVNSKPIFDYDTLALKWDNTPVDTSTQYIVLNYQLPHRWASGTSLYLHVHYLQHSAADTCEWYKAEYKWTDMGETRAGAYTTIKTNNQTVYTYSANTLHQLAAFPAISGTGHTESSILQIKLYCYSDADLYSLDTDIHFEIDKPGSDLQFP